MKLEHCLGILKNGRELLEVPNFNISLHCGEFVTPIYAASPGSSSFECHTINQASDSLSMPAPSTTDQAEILSTATSCASVSEKSCSKKQKLEVVEPCEEKPNSHKVSIEKTGLKVKKNFSALFPIFSTASSGVLSVPFKDGELVSVDQSNTEESDPFGLCKLVGSPSTDSASVSVEKSEPVSEVEEKDNKSEDEHKDAVLDNVDVNSVVDMLADVNIWEDSDNVSVESMVEMSGKEQGEEGPDKELPWKDLDRRQLSDNVSKDSSLVCSNEEKNSIDLSDKSSEVCQNASEILSEIDSNRSKDISNSIHLSADTSPETKTDVCGELPSASPDSSGSKDISSSVHLSPDTSLGTKAGAVFTLDEDVYCELTSDSPDSSGSKDVSSSIHLSPDTGLGTKTGAVFTLDEDVCCELPSANPDSNGSKDISSSIHLSPDTSLGTKIGAVFTLDEDVCCELTSASPDSSGSKDISSSIHLSPDASLGTKTGAVFTFDEDVCCELPSASPDSSGSKDISSSIHLSPDTSLYKNSENVLSLGDDTSYDLTSHSSDSCGSKVTSSMNLSSNTSHHKSTEHANEDACSDLILHSPHETAVHDGSHSSEDGSKDHSTIVACNCIIRININDSQTGERELGNQTPGAMSDMNTSDNGVAVAAAEMNETKTSSMKEQSADSGNVLLMDSNIDSSGVGKNQEMSLLEDDAENKEISTEGDRVEMVGLEETGDVLHEKIIEPEKIDGTGEAKSGAGKKRKDLLSIESDSDEDQFASHSQSVAMKITENAVADVSTKSTLIIKQEDDPKADQTLKETDNEPASSSSLTPISTEENLYTLADDTANQSAIPGAENSAPSSSFHEKENIGSSKNPENSYSSSEDDFKVEEERRKDSGGIVGKTNPEQVLWSVTMKLKELYPSQAMDAEWLKKTAKEQTRIFLQQLDLVSEKAENGDTQTPQKTPMLALTGLSAEVSFTEQTSNFQQSLHQGIDAVHKPIQTLSSSSTEHTPQQGWATQSLLDKTDAILAEREEVIAKHRNALARQRKNLEEAGIIQQTLLALNQLVMTDPGNAQLTAQIETALKEYQTVLDDTEKLEQEVSGLDQQQKSLLYQLHTLHPDPLQRSASLLKPQQASVNVSKLAQSNSHQNSQQKVSDSKSVLESIQATYPNFFKPKAPVLSGQPSLIPSGLSPVQPAFNASVSSCPRLHPPAVPTLFNFGNFVAHSPASGATGRMVSLPTNQLNSSSAGLLANSTLSLSVSGTAGPFANSPSNTLASRLAGPVVNLPQNSPGANRMGPFANLPQNSPSANKIGPFANIPQNSPVANKTGPFANQPASSLAFNMTGRASITSPNLLTSDSTGFLGSSPTGSLASNISGFFTSLQTGSLSFSTGSPVFRSPASNQTTLYGQQNLKTSVPWLTITELTGQSSTIEGMHAGQGLSATTSAIGVSEGSLVKVTGCDGPALSEVDAGFTSPAAAVEKSSADIKVLPTNVTASTRKKSAALSMAKKQQRSLSPKLQPTMTTTIATTTTTTIATITSMTTTTPSPTGFEVVLPIKPIEFSQNRYAALELLCIGISDKEESPKTSMVPKSLTASFMEEAGNVKEGVKQKSQGLKIAAPDPAEEELLLSKRRSTLEGEGRSEVDFVTSSQDNNGGKGEWQVSTSRRDRKKSRSRRQRRQQKRGSAPPVTSLEWGLGKNSSSCSHSSSHPSLQCDSDNMTFHCSTPAGDLSPTPPQASPRSSASKPRSLEENWENECSPFPVKRGMLSSTPTRLMCSSWPKSETPVSQDVSISSPSAAKASESKQNPSLFSLKSEFPSLRSFEVKRAYPAQQLQQWNNQFSSTAAPQLNQFSFTKRLVNYSEALSHSQPFVNLEFLRNLVHNNEAANGRRDSSVSPTADMVRRNAFSPSGEIGTASSRGDVSPLWPSDGKQSQKNQIGEKEKCYVDQTLPQPATDIAGTASSNTKTTETSSANTDTANVDTAGTTSARGAVPKLTAYRKLCLTIEKDFPNLKTEDMNHVISVVKRSYGGHFHGMLFSDIMKDVHKVVLRDFPEILRSTQQAMPVFTSMNLRDKLQKPVAMKGSSWQQTGQVSIATFKGRDNEEECSICLIEFTSKRRYTLECGHTFHVECIDRWVKDQGERTCPLCRTIVLMAEDFPHLSQASSRLKGDSSFDFHFPKLGS